MLRGEPEENAQPGDTYGPTMNRIADQMPHSPEQGIEVNFGLVLIRHSSQGRGALR